MSGILSAVPHDARVYVQFEDFGVELNARARLESLNADLVFGDWHPTPANEPPALRAAYPHRRVGHMPGLRNPMPLKVYAERLAPDARP
jgi:hypothetical protein